MTQSSKRLDAQLSQAEIQQVYNRIAWVYDLWGTITESHARQRAIAMANIQNGEQVLEVAIGTGLMMAEVVRKTQMG